MTVALPHITCHFEIGFLAAPDFCRNMKHITILSPNSTYYILALFKRLRTFWWCYDIFREILKLAGLGSFLKKIVFFQITCSVVSSIVVVSYGVPFMLIPGKI